MKHTPGPWHSSKWTDVVTGDIGWTIGTAAGRVPTSTFETDDEGEAEANALLMTSSPKLLEALQRLAGQCDRMRLPGQPKSDAERNASAVIAEATGEQP